MVELVDIIDKNNNVIKTVTRKEMRKKNLRHKATFVLVFNSKGEVLVTKRTKIKDVYPGSYEISHGGTVQSGETYEESAYREVKEEIGVKNVKLKYLFEFPFKDKFNNLIGKVYRCIYDGRIITQKEEVESYFFISVKELKKMLTERKKDFAPDNIPIFKKDRKSVV